MIHLKVFEKMLKNTDKIAINHPVNDFSGRLLKILKEISVSDCTVRRFFFDSTNISIICKRSDLCKILKIIFILHNDDKDVVMIVNKKDSRSGQLFADFYNFMRLKLKKYINDDDLPLDETTYKLPIDKLDDVIDELEEYYVYINTNKYNL